MYKLVNFLDVNTKRSFYTTCNVPFAKGISGEAICPVEKYIIYTIKAPFNVTRNLTRNEPLYTYNIKGLTQNDLLAIRQLCNNCKYSKLVRQQARQQTR